MQLPREFELAQARVLLPVLLCRVHVLCSGSKRKEAGFGLLNLCLVHSLIFCSLALYPGEQHHAVAEEQPHHHHLGWDPKANQVMTEIGDSNLVQQLHLGHGHAAQVLSEVHHDAVRLVAQHKVVAAGLQKLLHVSGALEW
jgi:hypothetical protein